MTLRDQLGRPVLFHWLPWHGKDGLASSIPGYDSRDPNVISSQLDAMHQLGGDGFGVIALTYGPTISPFIHQAVMAMCQQCNALRAPFALCMDPWTVKNLPASERDVAMINALAHPDTQFMLNSRSYLPGRPVLDFSTGIDPNRVLGNWKIWQNGPDFDWPRIPQQPNKTALPCVYLQFDDGTGPDRNKSRWDQTKPARIIPPMAGATFWSRKTTSPSVDIQYVQFATWNDYAEGTAIEPFASMLSGRIG